MVVQADSKNLKGLLKIVLPAVYFFYLLFLRPCSAYAAFPFKRLAGADRYDTALKVAEELNLNSGNVVLASGENYPDALCAAPLAKKFNATLLLVGSSGLSSSTVEEIKRRGYNKVFIIGGTAVISEETEKQLSSLGLNVERVGGKDRYETSVKVAEKIYERGTVGIVSGEGFADAVSFSAIAAAMNIPILLTVKDNLPVPVKDFITSKKIDRFLIIGGTASVGSGIESGLKNTERLWGKDRYETNEKIMDRFNNLIDAGNIYIVSGLDFPDALAASLLACENKGALYLASEYMAKEQSEYLKAKLPGTKNITVVGGSGALSEMSMYLIGLQDNPPMPKPCLPDWPDYIAVLNADETIPVYIKQKPESGSASLGCVYGNLAEVKVKDKVGDYYHIEFRRYGSSTDEEGYVAADLVKTVKVDKRYTVYVDIAKQKVSIYNSSGLVKEISCSTGKVYTETPKGRYLIGSRGNYFITEDGNVKCFYWVRFNNNYLFHSVLCDLAGNIIQSEAKKIGSKASHGCIRLPFDEAKWVYDNIPSNTLVTIN